MKHACVTLAAVTAWFFGGATFAVEVEVPPSVLRAEQQRIEVIAQAAAATISVFDGTGQGGGSGVVISPDGYALSNFHVTSPAGHAMKCSLSDGRMVDAVIVGVDPTGDVALIKLLGRDDFPSALIGQSDQVQVGDWCFAVGNPFLLATDFQPTVTYGMVSGVHRYQHPSGTLLEYTDCIQTDASINPGNSGGPLFDAQGRLIGINGRISVEKRGRVNVGVGYAISMNQINNFMGYLRSGRIVDHATLGASVSTDEEGRVVVTNILESSDAHRRGLRYGDEIVRFAGRSIGSVNGFKNVLGTLPKGWRVSLGYLRDGVRHDCLVRLAGVHRREELLAKIASDRTFAPPPIPGPRPGGDDPHEPSDFPDVESTPSHKKAMSEAVSPFFEARRGFANYYFNLQNRARVWQAFQQQCDCSRRSPHWTALAELDDGRDVRVELESGRAWAQFGKETVQVDGAMDLSAQLGPVGSGGLLAALHIWHRMLMVGPRRFGEVYYLGTAPTAGQDGLFDVLVGTDNVVETWFYFDPATDLLAMIEMYSDRDVDPCEIYLSEYHEVHGCRMPHRFRVQQGGHTYGVITIDRWKMPAANGPSI